MTIDEFIVSLDDRIVPDNELSKLRLIGRDLAFGVIKGFWDLDLFRMLGSGNSTYFGDTNIEKYFSACWGNDHQIDALRGFGIVYDTGDSRLQITDKAFHLLDEPTPIPTFISYKRNQSSTLALLILARFKAHGMEPFLDIQLEVGDDWHAELEEKVRESDGLILLLGPETLTSPYVRTEISWAIDAGIKIYPIWHCGFSYNSEFWDDVVSEEIDKKIAEHPHHYR